MKKGTLKPFGGWKSELLEGVSYRLWRKGTLFGVEYEVGGLLDRLAIDLLGDGDNLRREDELWQHSCFELFLKESTSNSEEYLECNFSPSGGWNVYSFSSYRTDMTTALLDNEPKISCSASEKILTLGAEVDLSHYYTTDSEIIAGVSCVIEDETGLMHYWALSHPRDKPDFHDCRSFLKIL